MPSVDCFLVLINLPLVIAVVINLQYVFSWNTFEIVLSFESFSAKIITISTTSLVRLVVLQSLMSELLLVVLISVVSKHPSATIMFVSTPDVAWSIVRVVGRFKLTLKLDCCKQPIAFCVNVPIRFPTEIWFSFIFVYIVNSFSESSELISLKPSRDQSSTGHIFTETIFCHASAQKSWMVTVFGCFNKFNLRNQTTPSWTSCLCVFLSPSEQRFTFCLFHVFLDQIYTDRFVQFCQLALPPYIAHRSLCLRS